MKSNAVNLRDLCVSDRALVLSYLEKYGKGLCEHSFVNLMVWRDFDRPMFGFVGKSLCVLIRPVDEQPFFLEPFSESFDGAALDYCLSSVGRMSRLSNCYAEQLSGRVRGLNSLPDHSDYVYSSAEMSELHGRKFDAKRNQIKRFTAWSGGFEYKPIDKLFATKALEVFDEWTYAKLYHEDPEPMINFSCQRLAIVRTFESFDELSILAGGLFVKGSLVGFVLGSAYSSEMAFMHFAYVRPNMNGAMQALFRESCRHTFKGFRMVNFEQDLGLAGLRKMKLSYHPALIEQKHEILLK